MTDATLDRRGLMDRKLGVPFATAENLSEHTLGSG